MEGKHIALGTLALLILLATIGYFTYGEKLLDDKIAYVSSTEYVGGDEGQTIIRLTDFKGTPLTATCTDTILYPDKTIFQSGTSMILDGQGNYYHNFTVPENIPGVYTTNVNCTYGTKTASSSKTFHVSLLNSLLQQRFDELNYSINTGHLEILNRINISQNNLTELILDTQNTVVEAQNNLSNQITQVDQKVQNNLSEIINLIQNINVSQTTSQEEILAIIQAINQTTTTTQTTLNTFQTETNNNIQTLNTTINGIQQNTSQILDIVSNLSLDVNITFENITSQIQYLTNLTINNQEITQENFSTIINLINQLNTSTQNNFNTVNEQFNQLNLTINQRFDILENITNWTHYNTELILIYLNISVNSINIQAESNDCWVGGQWVMFARVTNNFGQILDDNLVACNITTNKWGGPEPMTYDNSRDKFKYTHICDTPAGENVIGWTIQCVQT